MSGTLFNVTLDLRHYYTSPELANCTRRSEAKVRKVKEVEQRKSGAECTILSALLLIKDIEGAKKGARKDSEKWEYILSELDVMPRAKNERPTESVIHTL